MAINKIKIWQTEIGDHEEWSKLLADPDKIIICEIYSAWFGNCTAFSPIIDNIMQSSETNQQVLVWVRVNIARLEKEHPNNECPLLLEKFSGYESPIPLFLFIKVNFSLFICISSKILTSLKDCNPIQLTKNIDAIISGIYTFDESVETIVEDKGKNEITTDCPTHSNSEADKSVTTPLVVNESNSNDTNILELHDAHIALGCGNNQFLTIRDGQLSITTEENNESMQWLAHVEVTTMAPSSVLTEAPTTTMARIQLNHEKSGETGYLRMLTEEVNPEKKVINANGINDKFAHFFVHIISVDKDKKTLFVKLESDVFTGVKNVLLLFYSGASSKYFVFFYADLDGKVVESNESEACVFTVFQLTIQNPPTTPEHLETKDDTNKLEEVKPETNSTNQT
ncbi:hypothetical protein RFI_20537 [Reticulomyxa filosa]|uniref:Thioredoxin domain-containing protein n=1 Tax=Reticulomyxa filosa TaxID=46433 RepID=X6MUM2_RETFI|nr:hypothetical protein RFI_20537 [Reticulomyxa filosa]|eukprot:ETO16805.1 hypothetical protein RFI_20537 [Reticulomyxa filosa]